MCHSRLPPRCGTAPLLTPLRLGLSHLTRTAGCYSPAGYFHIPFLSFLNCDVSHVLSTLRTPRLAGRRRPFTDPFGRVHPPGFRPHSPAFHSRKLSAILSSTEPHPHLQTPPPRDSEQTRRVCPVLGLSLMLPTASLSVLLPGASCCPHELRSFSDIFRSITYAHFTSI